MRGSDEAAVRVVEPILAAEAVGLFAIEVEVELVGVVGAGLEDDLEAVGVADGGPFGGVDGGGFGVCSTHFGWKEVDGGDGKGEVWFALAVMVECV